MGIAWVGVVDGLGIFLEREVFTHVEVGPGWSRSWGLGWIGSRSWGLGWIGSRSWGLGRIGSRSWGLGRIGRRCWLIDNASGLAGNAIEVRVETVRVAGIAVQNRLRFFLRCDTPAVEALRPCGKGHTGKQEEH